MGDTRRHNHSLEPRKDARILDGTEDASRYPHQRLWIEAKLWDDVLNGSLIARSSGLLVG